MIWLTKWLPSWGARRQNNRTPEWLSTLYADQAKDLFYSGYFNLTFLTLSASLRSVFRPNTISALLINLDFLSSLLPFFPIPPPFLPSPSWHLDPSCCERKWNQDSPGHCDIQTRRWIKSWNGEEHAIGKNGFKRGLIVTCFRSSAVLCCVVPCSTVLFYFHYCQLCYVSHYYIRSYHTESCYIILYYTSLCYTILYHTKLYYTNYTILYYTILYYTILYYTTFYWTRIHQSRLE